MNRFFKFLINIFFVGSIFSSTFTLEEMYGKKSVNLFPKRTPVIVDQTAGLIRQNAPYSHVLDFLAQKRALIAQQCCPERASEFGQKRIKDGFLSKGHSYFNMRENLTAELTKRFPDMKVTTSRNDNGGLTVISAAEFKHTVFHSNGDFKRVSNISPNVLSMIEFDDDEKMLAVWPSQDELTRDRDMDLTEKNAGGLWHLDDIQNALFNKMDLKTLKSKFPGQFIIMERSIASPLTGEPLKAQTFIILKHPSAKTWADCPWVFEHTPVSSFEILETYLAQEFESIKLETDPAKFQIRVLSLLYHYHTQTPFSAGSAAIGEWLEASLYQAFGYEQPERSFCFSDQQAQTQPTLVEFLCAMMVNDGLLKTKLKGPTVAPLD